MKSFVHKNAENTQISNWMEKIKALSLHCPIPHKPSFYFDELKTFCLKLKFCPTFIGTFTIYRVSNDVNSLFGFHIRIHRLEAIAG